MARRLFVVQDSFLIRGRGLVVLPGIAPEGDETFCIGDPLLLKRPDGSTLNSKIGGIELLHSPSPNPGIPIMFTGLMKDDVPIGTEVWSVQNNPVEAT